MGIYLIEVRHKTIRKKAIQQTEKITEQRPNIKKNTNSPKIKK